MAGHPLGPGNRSARGALLQPLGTRDDGTPIMVGDRVAEAVRLGASLADGALRAGVSAPQLHTWVRSGNRLASALETGALRQRDLNAQQRAEVALAATVEQAASEGKLLLLGLLERLSRGAEVRTITERIDAQGNVVERYERTEHHAPDAATIRWRLERRWPDEWAARQRLEVTGADGAPLQVDVATRAAELAEALRNAPPPVHANGNGSGGNGAGP
jgi:hypothetical protein